MKRVLAGAALFASAAFAPQALAISQPAPGSAPAVPAHAARGLPGYLLWVAVIGVLAIAGAVWWQRSGGKK
ncbi:MAG TPA: hypothetical protein VMS93_05460 [Candidatus Saccharimonadales bacterium]|nr:hypothetical protein [Candidatus Saccharimonadales bacterium]